MIIESLSLPGKIVEIPNANRNDFAKFLSDEGYKTGAEIGVNKGEYGQVLCGAGLKVYGIDCWENYRGYKREGTYKSSYEEAVGNLKGLDYTIIKKYSMDALADFEDDSLDFVYIDANHTLPYVCMDIFGWERKVKRGGIISGHDYANIAGFGEREHPKIFDGCHVKTAVHACIEIMRIPKLYVLGERYSENRDRWRTWFFFRP
jgi:hypothetical protein